MQFMTIIIESRKYIFYIKNDEYWVTYADNEYNHYLTEEETKELLKFVFSTEINYSHNENGYEIYLDKMGNKRYFKDGKEDYGLFFLNNGESALLSIEDEKTNEKKDSLIKRIILNIEFGLIIFLTTLNITNIVRYAELKYRQPEVTQIPIERIDVKEAAYLIDDSTCLSLEEKQYFKNIVFLVDVLTTAEPSRAEELRERLTELGILTFTEDELNDPDKDDVAGYYNDLVKNNKIHLRDYTYFDYAAAHEFVHLCQDPSCPSYVREACAEIMAHEYFGTYLQSYPEARKNINYLMEIIGPQPVMECNFKGETISFRLAIREYLSKEDTDDLMSELYTSPKKADHEKIRQLLEKMADKKFENQDDAEYQKQQIAIRSAHRSERNGFYFNQHASKYFVPMIAYYEVEETYTRDLDREIEELKVNRDLQPDEMKEVFEDEKNDESTIYVDFKNPSTRWTFTIKDLKEQYLDDYYQFFMNELENRGESYTITLQRTTQDPQEIVNELNNAQEDTKYYAYTADDCLHISVNQDGNYKMIRHLESEMPSLDTLFPEQTTPHPSFQAPGENTTFKAFK